MLGVCGQQEDAALLEQFMMSSDRKKKAGLDALIACYLLLAGDEGLGKVEQAFFQNADAEYADTYAAIMAIRFHGTEVDVFPRQRLTKALRHMLDRPDLADLVIPDLAKWEDWSVMGKLVDLFVTADENSSWVRVPVINYLRACPLPVAKEKIEFLKTIDGEAVKRAMTFYPEASDKKNQSQSSGEAASADQPVPENATGASDIQRNLTNRPGSELRPVGISTAKANLALATPRQSTVMEPSAVETPTRDSSADRAAVASTRSQSLASIAPPETINQVESIAEQGPNFWKLLGVVMASGAACFFAMRNALGVQS